jgi:hypothetical protein
MPYIRCPTCNKLLGNRRIVYEKTLGKIYSNNLLSEDEKKDKHQELIKTFELNPCCVNRFITEINKELILIT